MRNRVPGYLGNTSYWFGEAGGLSGMMRRERRSERRAKLTEARAKAQAQTAARKAAKKPTPQPARKAAPKPTAPPTITPKAMAAKAPAAMMRSKAQASEQDLMEELESIDDSEEEMSFPSDGGGGGGGGGSAPSGAPAPTADELIEQRSAKAVAVAEKLAAEREGRPYIPKAAPVKSLPQASFIAPARSGIFGPILDALFGPPPSMF